MTEDISVNTSTCKKFLLTSGLRVSFESVKLFQKELNRIAIEIVKFVKKYADEKNKKTIMNEHLESALTHLKFTETIN